MTRTIALGAALALLAACTTEPTAGRATAPRAVTATPASDAAGGEAALGEAVIRDLATLRRATARFHRFAAADSAGWNAQITGCMTDPVLGGMGFHYGNPSLIDGALHVDEPEVLLYEPEKNGTLRLVAVEYIVPYAFHSRDAAPPVLLGQPFIRNDAFQLWGLHAWIGTENPSGLFADWNPRVTCDHAVATWFTTTPHESLG